MCSKWGWPTASGRGLGFLVDVEMLRRKWVSMNNDGFLVTTLACLSYLYTEKVVGRLVVTKKPQLL